MKNFAWLIGTLFISTLVYASTWDDKFAEVCKYDHYCSRLKNDDGTWRPLRPEILAIYRTAAMKQEILSAARRFGVDPAAIAAAVATENSLNVTLARHQTQDWLAANLGITKIGDKSFSIGIGEIHADTAMEAEAYCAKLEKRAPRTQSEMITELSDPLGSIRTAAMIIREAQDVYKQNGFDITKEPGVLATVYNLGKPAQRAAAAKAAGTLPKVNYFGLFTQKNIDEIRSTIGLSTGGIATRKGAAPGKPKTPVIAAVSTVPGAPLAHVPMANQLVANRGIPLATSAPICLDEGYGEDDDPTKIKFAPPSGSINPGETITELGRGLDCDSKIWKLIKSPSGVVGWVSDDTLSKSASMQMAPKQKCSEHADAKCSKGIADGVKDYLLSQEGKTRVWLKPYSKGKDPSFAQADMECSDDATRKAEQASYNRNSPYSNGSGSGIYGNSVQGIQAQLAQIENYVPDPPQKSDLEKLSTADLKKKVEDALNIYKAERARMAKELGVDEANLADIGQPYIQSAMHLNNVISGVTNCQKSLQAESLVNCLGNLNLDPDISKIAKIHYSPSPSLQEITDTQNALYSFTREYRYSYSRRLTAYDPTEDEVKNTSIPQIRSSLKACFARFSSIYGSTTKDLDAKIVDATKAVDDANKAYQNAISPPNKMGSPPVALTGAQTQAFLDNIEAAKDKLNVLYEQRRTFSQFQITIDSYTSIPTKATDKDLQNFKFYVLAAARECNARLNLIKADDISSDINENIFACDQAPELVSISMGTFAKEYLKKTANSDPMTLAQILSSTINNVFSGNLLNVLSSFLSQRESLTQQLAAAQKAAAAAAASTGTGTALATATAPVPPTPQTPELSGPPSTYCPGKTAEFLGDLLKNNACIEHIYVPSRWVAMKLKDYASKVIYREFDKKDRYLVEYGDSSCK